MHHSFHRILAVFTLLPLLGGSLVAQLKVSVFGNAFKVEDLIEAKVTNESGLPVSYCLEFGQWSPHAGTIENTPVPFYMEAKNGDRWNILINGPDVGSSRHPITLGAGASSKFPFRLNETGQIRLVLYYWTGERSDVCDDSTKGRKTARSKVFSIVKD